MIPSRHISSPNFDKRDIPVEYLVLHATGTTLAYTLSIFCDSASKVSSHLIIGENGQVYEMVRCWEGQVYRAWHAGKSRLSEAGRELETFNDFSIGIELVNLNGNLQPYTEKQYLALIEVIDHLKTMYPALASPERIIGHEQIAGWRGKCDPGWQFDWKRIYDACYPGRPRPARQPNLPVEMRDALEELIKSTSEEQKFQAVFWCSLSSFVEKMLGYMATDRLREQTEEVKADE